jgi:predicted lipoprotein with Yx(FWY)xxD motif
VRASMKFLIPMVAAALLLSACGGSSSSSSSAASPQTGSSSSSMVVKTASNSSLGGTVLVNAKGLTLYRLSGEQGGKFICTSAACVQTWHPLVAPSGGTPSGSVGSLGVVKRPDGTEQVTYKGMPLYTFVQDHAPGDAHGQGFKDVGTWNAVTTTASSASTPTAPTTSTSKSGGYGY